MSLPASRLRSGTSSSTGRPYLLGTDDQGRDMLSGIFYGLRISLSVGVASTVIALMYMRLYMDLELEDDDNTQELSLFDPKIVRKSGYYG